MPKVSVVFEDKIIVKDDISLNFETDEAIAIFDAVVAAQGDENFHAIQWDGTSGEIEYPTSDTPNAPVAEAKVNAYIAAFEQETERAKQVEKTEALTQDAEEAARSQRDSLLKETDWWAMADRVMTAEQTAYRQSLRDLPASADWSPSFAWDDATWSASLTGVTWPTKPE